MFAGRANQEARRTTLGSDNRNATATLVRERAPPPTFRGCIQSRPPQLELRKSAPSFQVSTTGTRAELSRHQSVWLVRRRSSFRARRDGAQSRRRCSCLPTPSQIPTAHAIPAPAGQMHKLPRAWTASSRFRRRDALAIASSPGTRRRFLREIRGGSRKRTAPHLLGATRSKIRSAHAGS